MNPRDSQIVLDKYIIFANAGKATTKDFAKPLSNYAKFFIRDKSIFDLSCASIIRLGKDIIIDSNKNANTEESYKYIKTDIQNIMPICTSRLFSSLSVLLLIFHFHIILLSQNAPQAQIQNKLHNN